ncbi:hypothetical protein Tco_1393941 [Tanacetum coccineum]
MAARMASVVDGVGDGGGMMRRWCGCGDEVRGGCDDDESDREVRKLFGAHRKTPPEKFSGGGAAVVAGIVAGDGGGAVAG